MTARQDLFVSMALQAWNSYVNRTDEIFNGLSDEEMLKEISPGRNSVVYIMGHLTAVNDRMLPLLGFGERAYPGLDHPFLSNPDHSGIEFPPMKELRAYWHASNATLTHYFNAMSPHEWFQRHNAVSEEDFSKEPHRNKLNVLINRTNHLSYHLGQIILVTPGAED